MKLLNTIIATALLLLPLTALAGLSGQQDEINYRTGGFVQDDKIGNMYIKGSYAQKISKVLPYTLKDIKEQQKQDDSEPKPRKSRSDTGRIAETAKAVIAYIELGIEKPTAEEVKGKAELLFKHPIGRTTVQNVLDRLINEVIPDKKPI